MIFLGSPLYVAIATGASRYFFLCSLSATVFINSLRLWSFLFQVSFGASSHRRFTDRTIQASSCGHFFFRFLLERLRTADLLLCLLWL